MRTTVIPAQVTTVEDTIAGNLTLTQLLLLLAPVLGSTAIYTVLPQRLAFTAYKIPLMVILSLIFVILSLRIKGKLVLNWLVILVAFALRPHLYLYDKNTLYAREPVIMPAKKKRQVKAKGGIKVTRKVEPVSDRFDYIGLVRDMDVNIRFTKKGLLVAKNI